MTDQNVRAMDPSVRQKCVQFFRDLSACSRLWPGITLAEAGAIIYQHPREFAHGWPDPSPRCAVKTPASIHNHGRTPLSRNLVIKLVAADINFFPSRGCALDQTKASDAAQQNDRCFEFHGMPSAPPCRRAPI